MISLWHMLVAFSGASAFAGALVGAKLEGSGSTRLVVGTLLGIGLGFLSAVRIVGQHVVRSIDLEDTSAKTPARLPLLYLATALWVLGPSLFLSIMVVRSIIRFTLP